MSSKRVLMAVTHLLGVGHLARTAAIGRGFVRNGHAVSLMTGGVPTVTVDAAGLAVVQLPPVRVLGTDFRDLRDEAGEPAGERLLEGRIERAVAAVREIHPDILFVEQYPFGRRVLRREFDAVIAAARALNPRPAVICSLRDVLVAPTRPSKVPWADEVLGRGYDAVLVHGDEAFLSLAESWPASEALLRNLAYTGFVDAGGDGSACPSDAPREPVVIVTGGGGVAGMPLYRAAVAARAWLRNDVVLQCLVGSNVPERDFAQLASHATEGLVVERARRDFRALLSRSALCVARPGYNTVIDLTATRTPAILVPFEDGEESEQRIRAGRLAGLGQARLLPESVMTGERLAAEIMTAFNTPPPVIAFDTAGVANTVRMALSIGERVRREEGSRARLVRALDRAGRRLAFWWRDDDAVADTPELQQLFALAARFALPLSLAVVPAAADGSLARAVEGRGDLDLLVHGLSHENRAPEGVKRYEFGDPAHLERDREDLAVALEALRGRLSGRVLPVFVPPWNRASREIIAGLPAAGYTGLSMFRGGGEGAPPGLTRINTHLDPIDWRAGGGLLTREALWSRLAEEVEARVASGGSEPIGLLTHHLRHDPWVWGFLEELLALLAEHEAVAFRPARDLFRP